MAQTPGSGVAPGANKASPQRSVTPKPASGQRVRDTDSPTPTPSPAAAAMLPSPGGEVTANGTVRPPPGPEPETDPLAFDGDTIGRPSLAAGRNGSPGRSQLGSHPDASRPTVSQPKPSQSTVSQPKPSQPKPSRPSEAHRTRSAGVVSEYDVTTGEFDAIDESDFEDDELVGTTLGDTYRVLRVLGEGGMGRVYEAQHTRIAGKRYAIKTLHPEFNRRADVRARFQREAEAAAAINHPNVVGVYDVNVLPDGRPFMVSELLEGRELGAYLDEVGRIPVPQAVVIVRQVCDALQAAHERGVIHRDVKPENVFLTGSLEEPVIKVLDFGISRLEGQQGNTLTRTGMVMGTPSYMGPEQARGERVDHRTDLYATGAILYRALTGKLPFDKSDATATLAAVLTEEPEPPRSIAPDIPASLELVIQHAMARAPDDRYQHMAELNVALAPHDVARLPPRPQSGTRPRLGSQTTVTAARLAREAQQARPKLALMSLAAGLGLVFGLIATIAGVLRFFRAGPSSELSGIEAAVIAVGAVCALTTPIILVARKILRERWDNTAKVLETYAQLRGPVLVGLGSSGLMALTALVLESAVLRNSLGLAWPLWGMVIPGVGVASAVAILVAQRADPLSLIGRLSNARAFAASASAVILFVVLGVAFRGTPEVAPSASTAADHVNTAASSSEPASSGKEAASAAPVVWTAESEKMFADLKRYQRQGNLAASIETLERLNKEYPDAVKEAELKKLLADIAVRAYYAGGPHSKRMTDMLLNEVGPTGPDILFELMATRGGTAAASTADRLLRDEDVRAKGTGGMRIAWEVRNAKGCAAKQVLVPRAAVEGDHRVLREMKLMMLCGRGRCCLANDKPLREAMDAILKRIQ